ncbi:DUF261 family protein [Candidatus Borreliella tachyglossi]|uniref:DUF261 family protein n=1 Tax=Candidatus Borreliella tachyglossi TaxID=1964448 RepID=UPI0040429162
MQLNQEDKRLILEIQKWGCYFLVIHYYISKFAGVVFSFADINSAYKECLAAGIISKNCYIKDATKILRKYGLCTQVRYEGAGYRCAGNEFEVTEVKIAGSCGSHFIATCDDKVCYDSLDLTGNGKAYTVFSKRIFILQGGAFV